MRYTTQKKKSGTVSSTVSCSGAEVLSLRRYREMHQFDTLDHGGV